MASNQEFVQYIADQLSEAGDITYRKMFGEYGLYCNGKIFAVICDNMLYVKITEAGRRIAPDIESAPPYKGAKNYFLIENVDDKDFLCSFVKATCNELPEPKVKRKKE